MNGGNVTVPAVDDRYSQLITQDIDQGRLSGRIGTMTAVLSSSQARPCIDVYPIPAVTNEMGVSSEPWMRCLPLMAHSTCFAW